MMQQLRQRAIVWIRNHQLLSGLGLVVIIVIFLTAISMTMYITSGASGLDLSRPGFDADRKKVEETARATAFSSTGEMKEADYTLFMEGFTEQRQKLKAMSSFDGQPLSDESLGLKVETEPNR